MTAVKVPARDIILEISDGEATPTWTEIGGLNSVTHNPGENEETTDSTTYESEGQYEQYAMQRGATLECEGLLIKDDTTGALDAGQSQAETLATAVGIDSRGQIRFRHPTDSTWRVWNCTASLGEQGGGNNDLSGWACTFTRCGAATSAAVA